MDPDLGSEYEEFAEFKWLEQMDGRKSLLKLRQIRS